MSIDFNNCSEQQLWEFVATHLKKKGIDTVLVGGAVVSIYSDGAYQSGDLDFITTQLFVKGLPEAMAEIGFIKNDKRHYVHPDCPHLFVEFPPGPLGIGEQVTISPEVVNVRGTEIKILSPTDCVKDRLASYIHFNDREGFEQAALIAEKHPINLRDLKKWCEIENSLQTFEEFMEFIKG